MPLEIESCPVAMAEAYHSGKVYYPGAVFRQKLFDHVKAASTPDQLKKVRQAMAMFPRMQWDPQKHVPTLKEKGLLS